MHWYRDLYIGETFHGQKKKLIRMVEKSHTVPGLYLLLIRLDQDHNQMEIVTQKYFIDRIHDPSSVLIVGLAFGEQEIRGLLVQITDQVYQKTGKADIKEYLLEKG